jgi:hypothetical protein
VNAAETPRKRGGRNKKDVKRRIIGGRSAEKVPNKNSIPKSHEATLEIVRISTNT